MTDTSPLLNNPNYQTLLHNLKTQIRQARVKAALAVNRELVLLYWHIGAQILEQQAAQGWGAKAIEQLSRDLRQEFPQVKGFSLRNLKYMRAFAAAYPDLAIVQQVVAQIPWGHNIRILDRVKDPEVRLWYARATVEYGWSRNVLVHQIETNLYERQGKAISNFAATLPQPQSDLVQNLLKSEYNLEFLELETTVRERELERALIEHMQLFLLELGVGFAFVGSQYPLEIGGEEFFIDLLFYHLQLRCYVVIELKTTAFKPAYAGQINFYVNAVDDLLRHETDQPTIGIVLCRSQHETIVRYALQGMNQPIGVSTYRTAAELPAEYQGKLPSAEELQAQIDSAIASQFGTEK
ncbi:MAG: DUF1016 domain-containing protein [Hormoscilla sp. GM7CHS1pb]|nr:DUF1016 domain-containing protein [Hormoscilla sp. GM7CHS1pb]